jgi:O-antigen ligase/polysaccharide polymerase Wzy-like membrane protein
VLSEAWKVRAPYIGAVVFGVLFAALIGKFLFLEPRYALAAITGVVLLSVAMSLANRLSDVLLYVLAFNLPFTSIEKTFLITPETTFETAGIAVGLSDLVLIAVYAVWFARIFITHQERFPRPTKLDWAVLAFVAVHALSTVFAVSTSLALLEVIRLGKYALMYFFVAHKLEKRHLRTVIAGIFFAIVLQSGLGIVQQRTGHLLGIGRTKGASDVEYEQYTITGFEQARAEGTTFDSHALGLFFAMTLPIPLALVLSPWSSTRAKIASGAVLLVGLPELAATFARAGWVAFGVAGSVILACFVKWKQWRRVLVAAGVLAVIGTTTLVPFARAIRTRLFEAPPELITARIETIEMALQIWRDHPWTGCGANSYMKALENKFSIFEGDPYFIPPHNMMVFILTEVGVIGLTVFAVLCVFILKTQWIVISRGDTRHRVLAAALLGAFLGFQAEGITDPIYITNVTYYLLWFEVGTLAAMAASVMATPEPTQATAPSLSATHQLSRTWSEVSRDLRRADKL